MIKGDKIEVVWLDPQTNAGWIEEKTYLEPVTTVGYYLEEDDTTLWLSSTYHKGTKEYADELVFPKGCILSRVKV